jgi:hypothetical protein
MIDFPEFQQEWLTNPPRIVADPLLAGDHPYQCVSLVKRGLEEIDGLNMSNSWWGNAIDYWTKTNPALLATRNKIETQDVEAGDIVILRTNGTQPGDFSGEGHIGWATGQENTTQFELLEQNGATGNGDGGPGDAIRTRWINKSRIAGVLRLKSSTPLPPPPPKWQVVETYSSGKQVKLNKQPTNLWGMNYDFDYMKDHPVEVHNEGEIWTVTNRVHHADGMDYYRREGQVDGFNVVDCDDYTPPPPIPPAGAIAFPTDTTPYTLVVDVPGYLTSNSAANHLGASVNQPAGEYMIFNDRRLDGKLIALNVTKTAGKPGAWINPDDNHEPVPEPEPVPPDSGWVDPRSDSSPQPETVPVTVVEPPKQLKPSQVPIGSEADTTWKSTFKPFHDDRSPEVYELLNGWKMKEYSGIRKGNIQMTIGKHIYVIGTFVKDGVKFYRPRDYKYDEFFDWWYGIPIMDDDLNPLMKRYISVAPKSFTELFHIWRDDIRNLLPEGKTWDVVFGKKKIK